MTTPSQLSTVKDNQTLKSSLILLFDVVLFFVLLNTLPFEPLANKGLALLAFVAVLWLTEAIHVTITALLVPILAVGLGLIESKQALATFSDPIIFLFFGGFALATALHIQKLDKMIANTILRMAGGRLSLAVVYLMAVTAALSMWISNTATAAMMLPLAMGVLSNLDQQKEHNTYVFVLLGIAYSASIGGMGTPVGSPPNGIVMSNLGMSFVEWFAYGLPIMILLMPLVFGVLYIVFKPNLSQRFEFNFEKIEFNKSRVITLIIFALIALLWVSSNHINPLLSGLIGVKKIGSFDSIIAILAAILLCASRVVTWDEIQKNTEWGVLMLFGGGLTLSAVLGKTGASKVMADGIVFLIEGGHFYLIGLIVAAFIIFLTEFTSNTASAALLVPIFISIAEALGMPTVGLAMIIGLGASCAFMLPVATPPNAIVFGTGQVKQNEMVKAGFWLNILCIFVITTFAYFFWL
ncbi:DASS family sodium-coupled anion symporter [Muribacter muris]|uniref:DASS family sodium-coupled anion symporter n=1 Tax=Muribacter muris TaxID=67855 RepID=A0A4Y9JV73_9PAST|nr:DASS family sodium-coupled anion symporter [Muribacter muris]MBF0785327.1 DASS family sodium-coupled anion symporter [Muribacter muris]TFV09724.1 DASS family sodium-coupled anion symporter [Muribacter muris]